MSKPSYIKDARTLTLSGGLAVLNAAIAEAERIGQPMCISVVDTGGNLLAFGRMDGSKALSEISTRNKAITATTYPPNPATHHRAATALQQLSTAISALTTMHRPRPAPAPPRSVSSTPHSPVAAVGSLPQNRTTESRSLTEP